MRLRGTVLMALLALAVPSLEAAPGPASETSPEAAPEIAFSARTDRAEVEVGGQVTLTLTLEGRFQGVELQPIQLPPGFMVLAQSQASNVSVRMGAVTRSLSLIYVLMPQEPGEFTLGPFQVDYEHKPVMTNPIALLVKKPVVPPSALPHPRYIL